MNRSVRSVLLAITAALALPLATLALAPPGDAASGGAADDSGVVANDDFFASFDVTSNDTVLADFDHLDVAPGTDTSVWSSDGFSSLQMDLSGLTSFTGAKAVTYELQDVDNNVLAQATLTVQVVARNLQVAQGAGKITVSWPGLPAGITALHISYGTSPVLDHSSGTHLTHAGTGPVDITGLTNGTRYYLYVTPQYNGADLQNGEFGEGVPRATNANPVAVDDTVSMVDNNPVNFSPLDNDTDPDNDQLTLTGHSSPAHGAVSCDQFGSCTYTPTGTRQDDSMTYSIADGYGGVATGTVSFHARNVTAASDTGNTFVDESVTVNELANDTGLDPTDTVTITNSPTCVDAYVDDQQHIVATGTVQASCTINYEIDSTQFQTLASSTVAMTVGAKRPLVANDDEEDVTMEVPTDLDVWVNDAFTNTAGASNSFPLKEGAGFTEVTAAPTHGTATLDFQPQYVGPHDDLRNVPVIRYVPDDNFHGDDTLGYRLADKNGHTDTATVTIHVGTRAPFGGYADTAIGTATVHWVNPSSKAIDDVVVCRQSAAQPGFPTAPTIDATGTCQGGVPVTVATGVPSAVSMTSLDASRNYVVSVFDHYNDGTTNGLWSDADHIFFTPGPESPSIVWYDAGNGTADPHQQSHISWTPGTGATGTTVAWTDADWPTSPNPTGPGTGHVVVAGGTNETDLNLPVGDWYVSVFSTNGTAYSVSDDAFFHVAAGDHAPAGTTTQSISLPTSTGKSITATQGITDADSDSMQVKSHTNPTKGTVSCFGTSCFYSAGASTGADSFTYVLSDHRFGELVVTVNINIVANHPPSAFGGFRTYTQNRASTLNLASDAFDADNDPLTFAVPGSVAPVLAPSASLNLVCSGNGSCTINPTTVGSFTFSFTVSDGKAAPVRSVENIQVVANQAPMVDDIFQQVEMNTATPTTIDLAANASDPEDQTLTFAITSPPQKGTLSGGCNADTGAVSNPATCAYTPASGRKGGDSFTWSASDGTTTSYASVDLDIQPVNHAPTTTGTTPATLATDNGHVLSFQLNATDQDSDPLTYTVVTTTTSAMGTLTCDTSGACTYTPNPTFEGPATFTYRANDGHVNSITSAPISITVTKFNQAPVATDDTASAHGTKPVVVGVTANDTDANADPLTAVKVTSPTHGTATCAAGSCTYTATSGYVGADSFTYRANDGTANSNVATVSVTVGANNPPVATNDAATTTYNTAKAVNVKANDTDADGDTLSYVKATNPLHGTATCTAAGSCTYTPNGTYAGTDTFTYTVSDGAGGSATGTVTMTISQTAGSGTIALAGATTRSVKLPVVLTGTMTPKVPGTVLKLQRKLSTATTWTTLTASATESSTGGYKFTYTQTTSGIYDYRVSSPSSGIRKAFTTASKRITLYSLSMPASSTTGNEYVTVKNTGTVAVNLLNWVLTTKTSPAKAYTLPTKSLAPGASVKIHPGFGTTTTTDLYLKKSSSAFGAHDTISLKDLAKTVVATRVF